MGRTAHGPPAAPACAAPARTWPAAQRRGGGSGVRGTAGDERRRRGRPRPGVRGPPGARV